MLGVIEPVKDAKNPKKKRETKIIKKTVCKDYFLKLIVQKNASKI